MMMSYHQQCREHRLVQERQYPASQPEGTVRTSGWVVDRWKEGRQEEEMSQTVERNKSLFSTYCGPGSMLGFTIRGSLLTSSQLIFTTALS